LDTSQDPSIPNPDGIDHYKANCEAFNHVLLAWNDEVKYAESLVHKRQHQLTAIAFVVGGAMIFVGALASNSTPPPSLGTIVVTITSGFMMLISINYTLTSDEFWIPAVRICKECFDFRKPACIYDGLMEAQALKKKNGTRSSRSFIEDLEEIQLWLILDKPADVSNARTRRLYAAYQDIKPNNDRLNTRIKYANTWFFRAVFAGLVAFTLYMLTIYTHQKGPTYECVAPSRNSGYVQEEADTRTSAPGTQRTVQEVIKTDDGRSAQEKLGRQTNPTSSP